MTVTKLVVLSDAQHDDIRRLAVNMRRAYRRPVTEQEALLEVIAAGIRFLLY